MMTAKSRHTWSMRARGAPVNAAVVGVLVAAMLLAGGCGGLGDPWRGASPQARAEMRDKALAGYRLRMAGHSDEARQLLTEAVAESPHNAPAQFELARTLLAASPSRGREGACADIAAANDAIGRAVEADAENPRYHYWAGVIGVYHGIVAAHQWWGFAATGGRMRDATGAYRKALDLKPDFHQARAELSGYYDRLPWMFGGDADRAEQEVRRLERMDPVFGAKARCGLMPAKTPDQQVALWEKVTAEHASRPDAHAELALAYARAGRAQEALAAADRAIELDPTRSTVLLDLAWQQSVSRPRQYDQARRLAERFIASKPVPPAPLRAQAMRIMARACKAQKQTARADALSAEADRLAPRGLAVRSALRDLWTPP